MWNLPRPEIQSVSPAITDILIQCATSEVQTLGSLSVASVSTCVSNTNILTLGTIKFIILEKTMLFYLLGAKVSSVFKNNDGKQYTWMWTIFHSWDSNRLNLIDFFFFLLLWPSHFDLTDARRRESEKSLENETPNKEEDCQSPTSKPPKPEQPLKVMPAPPPKENAWVKRSSNPPARSQSSDTEQQSPTRWVSLET